MVEGGRARNTRHARKREGAIWGFRQSESNFPKIKNPFPQAKRRGGKKQGERDHFKLSLDPLSPKTAGGAKLQKKGKKRI